MTTIREVNVQTGEDKERPMTAEEIAQAQAPMPTTIPQSVSVARGGIALIQAGLMTAVEGVINDPSTPPEVKWAWSRATEWERASPSLAYIASRANISEAQMDELFVAADSIKV